MVKKTELEQKTITELTVLCMGQGLDPTGDDKETLIARLLGKEKPKPKSEPAAEVKPPEPEVKPPASEPAAEPPEPEVKPPASEPAAEPPAAEPEVKPPASEPEGEPEPED